MKKYTLACIVYLLTAMITPVLAMDAGLPEDSRGGCQHTRTPLPEGFVDLSDIDPTIILSPRYSGHDNFIGRPINGYKTSRIILTQQAADALKKAQAHFQGEGYSLVVYDGYRPQTAVNDFMEWSKDSQDQKMKAFYYPRVDKEKVFELGYVAEKSGHSRGSTIDLTLIPLGQSLQPITPQSRTLRDGFEVLFLNDGTVDMGSSFDLFDRASHYENDLISEDYQQKRTYLKDVMDSCGFKNYAEEWWHFTLKDEPFPETYFDFLIE